MASVNTSKMVSNMLRFLSPIIKRTPVSPCSFIHIKIKRQISRSSFIPSALHDTNGNKNKNILDLSIPATFQVNTIYVNLRIDPGK